MRAQYNKILSGERLAPETRQDFINQAGGQYNAQLQGQKVLEGAFRGMAERSGMDPNQIVVDFGSSIKPPGSSPPSLPPGAKMEGGKIVSESGKFEWTGSAWKTR